MQADHIIKFSNDHPMMAPKIEAIRLSGGLMTQTSPPISQENILKGFKNLRSWVGQTPKIIKAKKSVASFKLRKGSDFSLMVTLRQQNVLNSFKHKLIYSLLEDKHVSTLLNNHINCGLKSINKLGGAGINVNIYLKGNVKEGRGAYFKSSLLLP